MTDIDSMLDRMAIVDAIERKGERAPVKGIGYAACVVHPPRPGIPLAMAIVHRAGAKFVVNLVRADVSIAESVAVLQRYGVSRVTGVVVGDDGDALADAVAGAVAELRKGALQ
jgi:hypothetical protein